MMPCVPINELEALAARFRYLADNVMGGAFRRSSKSTQQGVAIGYRMAADQIDWLIREAKES
jgi:hypothetical protein